MGSGNPSLGEPVPLKLYHIVAMAANRVIGKGGKLPWHFSVDLKKFKEITMGSTVIMGRKTFESIGKPLPGRQNFVLSRSVILRPQAEESQRSFARQQYGRAQDDSVHFFSSIESALAAVKTEKAFIIGGGEIFKQTLDRVDGIYLTQIEQDYGGDIRYPEIPDAFKEKSRETLQESPKIELIYWERK